MSGRPRERILFRDGSMAVIDLLVVNTADGWKSVIPIEG